MSDGIEAIKQIHAFGEYNTILIAIYVVVALALIILTLIQAKEDAGLSSTITGSSTNNFFEKSQRCIINGICFILRCKDIDN